MNITIGRIIARIELATSGYLCNKGWIGSRAHRKSIDYNGDPIPWFTYPALDFLEKRTDPDWRVLEYGSGAGTIWWSRRCMDVTAIEHNQAWASRIQDQCRARIILTGDTTAHQYVDCAPLVDDYDIIIVDGLYRNECIRGAIDKIKSSGVIVLDDAQRPEYEPSYSLLKNLGFKVIDFHGPQPVSKHAGCTSFFYRPENILGI